MPVRIRLRRARGGRVHDAQFGVAQEVCGAAQAIEHARAERVRRVRVRVDVKPQAACSSQSTPRRRMSSGEFATCCERSNRRSL